MLESYRVKFLIFLSIFGPATIGALSGYFSSVFCLLFDVGDRFTVVVGFAVMAFVLFVNSLGVKEAGYLQMAATLCKLVPVALLAIFGIWKGNGQVLHMG
ncbi:MAG: amino acid permease, partial [Pseudomonadota bacterium]